MVKELRLHELAKKVNLSTILTFRPKAAEMYRQAIEQLGRLTCDTLIDCSFLDIEICDVSFVDQFILSIQLMLKNYENVILRLSNCNEDILANIEGALHVRNERDKNKNKICLLYFDQGRYSILGKPEQNLKDTFESVQDHKHGLTARELTELQGIAEINSASNRLKRLFDARFVCRKMEITEFGRQHVYYIPEDY